MRPARLASLLLVAVAFVWGSTFVLVKEALRDSSPLLFNLLRMLLASAALLLVYGRALRGLTRGQWAASGLAGLCLAAGYQLQTSGLRYTTPSISAFVTGTVVVFVPFFSLVPRLRAPGAARPGFGAFAGAGLGFAGLLLLSVPPGERLAVASVGRGELLTLGCALAFTLHLLVMAHASLRVPFRALVTAQIGAAALVMALTLPVFEPHPYFHPGPRFYGAWLVAALLATAAAFAVQSWAQAFLPATHIALLFTLEPVFAGLTSFLVLDERLRGRALLGAALVLAGLVTSELPQARAAAGKRLRSDHV